MDVCKLCGEPADSLLHEIEELVMEMIKESNPDWLREDGSCQKCIDHYQDLDNAIQIIEPPDQD